jgi:catechol 2,3-dioxygenase-like lactoylglutathione lyase family enzyme
MRIQLALNVANLEDAISFYSTMLGAPPAKVKPGYANWAIADPPLKLVLFESPDSLPGSINHLGIETESADEVVAHESRMRAAGLTTTGIDDTECCFAEKVETWVEGPEGHRWEWYVKQGDTDSIDYAVGAHQPTEDQATTACCGPSAASVNLSTKK